MIQEFTIAKHRLLFDLEPDRFVSDNNLLWYAQNRQLPEPEVIHVMLRALTPGRCAIDAGANIGFFTVLMSKLVGDRGKVLAIEPDRRNVEKLKKNLDINSCSNVEILPFALGARRGKAMLHYTADNGGSSLFATRDTIVDTTIEVNVETIDHLRLRLPQEPYLLKMDIEGGEYAALTGSEYAIPCIITEVNEKALARADVTVSEYIRLARQKSYSVYRLDIDGASPAMIERGQRIKPTRENSNVLFADRTRVANDLWKEVEI